MKNKITKIAKQVRAELISFISDGANGFNSQPHLSGMCGYGAVMVFDALKKAGRQPKIAVGQGHYFTVCDGFLVDVTASQFGQSKIVVRDYEKVKKMIASNEYQMRWWQASLHNSVCSANICSNRKMIDDARRDRKSVV